MEQLSSLKRCSHLRLAALSLATGVLVGGSAADTTHAWHLHALEGAHTWHRDALLARLHPTELLKPQQGYALWAAENSDAELQHNMLSRQQHQVDRGP